MAPQISLLVVMLVSFLTVSGLARGTMGSMYNVEDERSLFKLLAEHEPPTLARYQLFPRDDVNVVTVTETVCGREPGASQTSSASDSVPGVSTSSSAIASSGTAIPSDTATPSGTSISFSTSVPASDAVPSSTATSSPTIAPSSTTLWTSTLASSLTSTIPVAPITSSDAVISSSGFSSISSASSRFSTSISSPATHSASGSTSSKTTGDSATATAPDSASTTEPSKSDAAFHPTGARTAMVVLLTLLSILFV